MKEKKEKENPYLPTTVYIPRRLLEEMDEYTEEQGYGTRSAMLRRAFFVLKKVFPIHSDPSQQEGKSLFNRLDSVEQKLEKIKLEQELDEKEKKLLRKRREIIKNGTVEAETDELLRVKQIRNAIIELLREFGPLKDFVLMDKLGETFERGEVWKVLMELQEGGIVDNNKNEWFMNNGQT
jgi:NurA-like 5'-3' nuclease